jgi:ABC-type dipeptide/oligopeptide/nickel transport system permease component
MVLALLVAPEGFFSSAIGKRLLNIVGVKSGTTARSVCLFLTIVFWGIPIWVAVHMLG